MTDGRRRAGQGSRGVATKGPAVHIPVQKVFRRTRFGLFALFGIVVLAISILSITTVSNALRDEYVAGSENIAKNIADSSVDILLNRNLATLQSLIDQFVQIPSIRYIYINSDNGEFLAHTFVPGIPEEVLAGDPTATEPVQRSLPGLGEFIEVGSPILNGVAGTVHVGMDLELLNLNIRRAVGRQIYLLCGILIAGVLLTIWLFGYSSRPLGELLHYLVGMARSGDEESASHQVLQRNDEIGDMARLMRYVANPNALQAEQEGTPLTALDHEGDD